MNSQINEWYKLDNAAKLFPAVSGISNTSIFRVSMILKDVVDSEILQHAINLVSPRFPSLMVKIRRGVFWNFLEHNPVELKLKQETTYPCSTINARQNNNHLLKILYYNKRISIEAFHSITDGAGCVEFLKTLVYQYLKLKGEELSDENLVLLPNDLPKKYETEDSLKRYYVEGEAAHNESTESYHITGTRYEPFGHNVTHGVMSAKKLNDYAKSLGATMTEYLCAVLIHSIYKEGERIKKNKLPISIAIPVNLRKMFPSKTLRNFFAVINVRVKTNDELTFEEILKIVKDYFIIANQKATLEKYISKNYKHEKGFVRKLVPLFIKKIAIKFVYDKIIDKNRTMTLSNVGNIAIPQSMSPFIERMDAIMYPSPRNPISVGLISVNDKLNITFIRTIVDNEIIADFFNTLSGIDGLDIQVYSNNWGFFGE